MAKEGRPLKFKSVKELQSKIDGDYLFDGDKLRFDDFAYENDLVSRVTENIDSFVRDYLNDSLISFEVDKPINKQTNLQPRGRRIDLFVVGKNSVYIIEFKNAKNTSEIRSAIGQLLDYGREYLDPKKELILITNMYDVNTAKTIEYYNLPIRYIIISNKQSLEVKKICKKEL